MKGPDALKSGVPLGPPLFIALTFMAGLRFMDTEVPSSDPNAMLVAAIFIVTFSAIAWKVWEIHHDSKAIGFFPNPWDEDEDK